MATCVRSVRSARRRRWSVPSPGAHCFPPFGSVVAIAWSEIASETAPGSSCPMLRSASGRARPTRGESEAVASAAAEAASAATAQARGSGVPDSSRARVTGERLEGIDYGLVANRRPSALSDRFERRLDAAVDAVVGDLCSVGKLDRPTHARQVPTTRRRYLRPARPRRPPPSLAWSQHQHLGVPPRSPPRSRRGRPGSCFVRGRRRLRRSPNARVGSPPPPGRRKRKRVRVRDTPPRFVTLGRPAASPVWVMRRHQTPCGHRRLCYRHPCQEGAGPRDNAGEYAGASHRCSTSASSQQTVSEHPAMSRWRTSSPTSGATSLRPACLKKRTTSPARTVRSVSSLPGH